MLAPTVVALIGRLGRRAPLSTRLALRDLGRYRARSASTMAAVSVGVMVAMIVMLGTTERYAAVLDYVGPNLAPNELIVYAQSRGPVGPGQSATSVADAHAAERAIAAQLDATSVLTLESAGGVSLTRDAPGRNFSGQVFVATPALLRQFHIDPASVDPRADVLTMRPGMSSISKMLLVYNGYYRNGSPTIDRGSTISRRACPPTECLALPVIQEVGALPSGTSAPNTVVTEHALRALGLAQRTNLVGWMVTAPAAISSSQVAAARQTAASAGVSVESKNEMPTSGQVVFWATLAAYAIALCVLAMSIGLIRAESAGDRRTLAATGARPATLRAVTAVSAGAIALFGALLGALGAYLTGAAIFAQMSDGGTLLERPHPDPGGQPAGRLRRPPAGRRGGRLAAGRARADRPVARAGLAVARRQVERGEHRRQAGRQVPRRDRAGQDLQVVEDDDQHAEEQQVEQEPAVPGRAVVGAGRLGRGHPAARVGVDVAPDGLDGLAPGGGHEGRAYRRPTGRP